MDGETSVAVQVHRKSLTVGISILALFAASGAVYYLTAFRTITWWDNAEYALGAITLGVVHPPGSLLLTILGWLVTRIPTGLPAIFELNLLAGLLAAVTVGAVALIGVRLYRLSARPLPAKEQNRAVAIVGIMAALAGLSLAFGNTLWLYAVKFTPYILTPLFTCLILLAFLKWWTRVDQYDAVRWVLILMFLFGLDFSVHRTNLLLLPAVLPAMLVRRPKIIISGDYWAGGAIGLVLGLAVSFFLMPIAMRDPYLNIGNPSSLGAFWDYISVKQYGGSFLVNLFPRKAPFWGYQVKEYVDIFSANFLNIHGRLWIAGLLPGLLGLIGFVGLWVKRWRLGLAFTLLFLAASLGAVFYFNVTEGFFRSLDRHYLPSFIIFGVYIAFGAGFLAQLIRQKVDKYGWAVAAGVAVVLLGSAGSQFLTNYRAVDGSRNTFARDTAANIFRTLPDNTILFTFGDNDTYPLFYMQGAVGARPDVTIINLPLSNTTWFRQQVMERDSNYPTMLTPQEMASLSIRPWSDTTVAVALPPVALADTDTLAPEPLPELLLIRVPPTAGNQYLLIQDQVLLDLIRANNWRRPIYFSGNYSWLSPHLQYEGLTMRLVPASSADIDKAVLRGNLFDQYIYDGYADPTLPLDMASRNFGVSLFKAFIILADVEAREGDRAACWEVRQQAFKVLPPERLDMDERMVSAMNSICGQPGQQQDESTEEGSPVEVSP
jgi:hypothetical protein